MLFLTFSVLVANPKNVVALNMTKKKALRSLHITVLLYSLVFHYQVQNRIVGIKHYFLKCSSDPQTTPFSIGKDRTV